MTIPPLPPDLADFVTQQVGSGRYESEADVLAEGLRLLRERQRRITELQAEINPALERLEKGEGRELDVEDVIRRGLATAHKDAL
jgi:putative addiction module CopG family antidote